MWQIEKWALLLLGIFCVWWMISKILCGFHVRYADKSRMEAEWNVKRYIQCLAFVSGAVWVVIRFGVIQGILDIILPQVWYLTLVMTLLLLLILQFVRMVVFTCKQIEKKYGAIKSVDELYSESVGAVLYLAICLLIVVVAARIAGAYVGIDSDVSITVILLLCAGCAFILYKGSLGTKRNKPGLKELAKKGGRYISIVFLLTYEMVSACALLIPLRIVLNEGMMVECRFLDIVELCILFTGLSAALVMAVCLIVCIRYHVKLTKTIMQGSDDTGAEYTDSVDKEDKNSENQDV